jgi:adenosine deaminase CECR1
MFTRFGVGIGTLVLLLVSSKLYAQSLDEKLNAQFALFETAQKRVVDRVNNVSLPVEQRVVSREEWESWLALQGQMAFTSADFAALQLRHQLRIRDAKAAAHAQSVIDLDAIRALDNGKKSAAISSFCQAFPKGGMLHVHPWGAFPADALASVFRKNNPDIAAKSIADDIATPGSGMFLYSSEMAWLLALPPQGPFLSLLPADQERLLAMTRLPPGSHEFERFESVFQFVGLPVATWSDYEFLLRAFAERASHEGVRYVEFTTGIRNADSLALYQGTFDRIASDFGLVIRLNASFSRWDSIEGQRAGIESLLPLRNPILVGIDLLANENGAPALEKGQVPYARVLGEVWAGNSTLHRTMHAGELGDARNPRDAMILGAERLGHGVRLSLDPIATEYARSHNVAVEVNLTSNVKLRAVDSVQNHPFLNQLRLGIPVSLSTDDEGIFDTDIVADCEKAVGLTDVQYSEMKAMSLNGIATSFLPFSEKAALLKVVEADLARFEASWAKP